MLNIDKQVLPITLDIASDVLLDNADIAIDDFNAFVYTLTGSVSLGIGEASYKRYMQRLAEAINHHSANSVSFRRTFLDEVTASSRETNNNRFSFIEYMSVNEASNKNMKFYQSDNFMVQDAKTIGTKLNERESLSARDAETNKVDVHKFDTLTSKDNQWKYIGEATKENLSIMSARSSNIRIPKSESAKISSHEINSICIRQYEKVMYYEPSNAFKIGLNPKENVHVTPTVNKSDKAILKDTFGVGSKFSRLYVSDRRFFDTLTSKDNQWKYDRVPKEENLTVGAKDLKTYKANKSDGLKFVDAHRKMLNLIKNETLLNGSLMRSQTFFDRFITEKLKALETQNKAVYKRLSESALLKDAKRANYDKNMYEYSEVGEIYTRTWRADRAFQENANIKEAIAKKDNIRNFEEVTYKDIRILPNPRGVLSDIFVRENEMDLSDFEQIAERPAGYNSFSPFRVGDYEYKDALYRIRIDKTGGTANPLIYDYKIHVDIDDVRDNGTLDIPAEETKVYFNRSYYIDPDVVVNVISGEEGVVAIPYIVATDGKDEKGRYFTVVLKDAKGNPVAGTISWNSNGY